MLNLFRRATCYNQGELAQFFILASYFHRDLKDAICEEGDELTEKISSKHNDLVDFLNLKFAQICDKNFEYIVEYFGLTNRSIPRVCLKGTHVGEIVDIYRNEETPYLYNYSHSANTGFDEVIENGHYYLNNNIPVSIINNEYHNPRLQEGKLEQFKSKFSESRKSDQLNNLSVEEWCSIWMDSELFFDPEDHEKTCYKSTLIIPLTLRNISLSELFLELTSFPDIDRAIYGFLCFDSTLTNFFKQSDIEMGYIFADILSLYLVNALNYTEMSDSFSAYRALCNCRSMSK